MKRPIALVPGDMPGVEFFVVLVEKGDRYGLDDCLVHDKDDPLVEFYDVRYNHTKYGQFVQSYYARTLLGEDGFGRGYGGIDLNCGVPDWKVPASSMHVVRGALAGVLGRVATIKSEVLHGD